MVFSKEWFTAWTLIAWAIILWVWINILVYADDATCWSLCSSSVIWESCWWLNPQQWTCQTNPAWWSSLICTCNAENGANNLCGNGLDDDDDWLVDCQDNGCSDDTYCIELWSACEENELWDDCNEWNWTCAMSSTNWDCIADNPMSSWCSSATDEQSCSNWDCQWIWDITCTAPAEICTDWIDNDWDWSTDCLDSECVNHPSCYESSCTDWINNDPTQDSLIDCNVGILVDQIMNECHVVDDNERVVKI